MRNTFDATNTLRGIAILSVVVNHYLNRNISGDYTGFAAVWISLFFIVSGYGIYISLEKLLVADNHIEPKNILKFYYLRIIRIYPLFWTAYIIQQLVLNEKIYFYSLIGLHGSGHFWFIPAILQCYIVAPLVFLLIYHNRLFAFFLILILYVSSNFLIYFDVIPESLLELLKFLHLNWNNTYFLYIMIFSLSMLLPRCINDWDNIEKPEKLLYPCLLLVLTLFFMILVKWRNDLTYLYDLFVITLIPVILLTISSIYLIYNKISSKYLSWLGRISYSIYLFHIIYFLIINIVFQYKKDSVKELIITLILFPIFLAICAIVQRFGNRLSALLKNLILPHPTAH